MTQWWSIGRRMLAVSAALALLVCAGLAILVVAITRLQDATSQFEESHPRLTLAIGAVAEALARLGI